jgi:hypothetical protein
LGRGGDVPQAWIDTRNYYTHWDEALQEGILDITQMHFASVRLKQLVRVLFLQLTGVSEATLTAACGNRSDVSRYVAQLNFMERGDRVT